MGGDGGTACTLGGGGGGGGAIGWWVGAREGDGGAMSSAAERHRAADRAEEPPGLAKVGRGARGARGVGGARTPLGGDESRLASSTGANPGGGGGERHAVPSRPNRSGTGPAGWIPGGRASWAPGIRGPGPWWLWAGAGETGRAFGLRLVRGGVEGLGGLGGEPEGPPGATRGLPRAAVP